MKMSMRGMAVLLAAAAARLAAAATGDSQCLGSLCIHATLNGTEVEYVMESKTANVGWMAIGFGTMMSDSKMVIMWKNEDGTVTLSQRTSPYEVMPTVDSNPPRIAATSLAASSLTSDLKLAFTIPHDGNMEQRLIWAMCSTNPGSPAIDAPLKYHQGHGGLIFDLSKSLDQLNPTATTRPPVAFPGHHHGGSRPTGTAAASEPSQYHIPAPTLPLLPYQRMIVAHAAFCVIGFMFLLPAGALLARYLRTFSPSWFTGHWVIQFALSAPVILMGVFLGTKAVNAGGMSHLDDAHKKCGAVLVALYFGQCALGAFVHFVKPARSISAAPRRPIRNYVHGALGVFTVLLGGLQARSGFAHEWTATTARKTPGWAGAAWWAWAVLVPVAYGVGLSLLPRQFAQERAGPGVEGRGLLEDDALEKEEDFTEELAMKERVESRRSTAGYREI